VTDEERVVQRLAAARERVEQALDELAAARARVPPAPPPPAAACGELYSAMNDCGRTIDVPALLAKGER
jgi:hypothetical protein